MGSHWAQGRIAHVSNVDIHIDGVVTLAPLTYRHILMINNDMAGCTNPHAHTAAIHSRDLGTVLETMLCRIRPGSYIEFPSLRAPQHGRLRIKGRHVAIVFVPYPPVTWVRGTREFSR
jgi:hypothetical protein